MTLLGKRAIVTGAASGIGRSSAMRLAEEGAKVAVLDVDGPGAEAVADAIRQAGGEAIAVQADVASEGQGEAAVAKAVLAFSGLDTVIANAGVMLMGQDASAADLKLSVWQKSIDINLTGMFLTCKHGIRALLKNGGGSVVIISSPTGQLGCAPTFTAYSSRKSGTFGLMRSSRPTMFAGTFG